MWVLSWEVYVVDNEIELVVFHIHFHGEQVNKQIMLKEAWSLNAHTHAVTDTAVWAHLLLWRSELIPAWSHRSHDRYKL